jgi:hypothetical protein
MISAGKGIGVLVRVGSGVGVKVGMGVPVTVAVAGAVVGVAEGGGFVTTLVGEARSSGAGVSVAGELHPARNNTTNGIISKIKKSQGCLLLIRGEVIRKVVTFVGITGIVLEPSQISNRLMA